MRMRVIGALALVVLAFGCATEEPAPVAESTESDALSAEAEASRSPNQTASPDDDGWQTIEFDQPYTYEDAGVALHLYAVAIGDPSLLDDTTGRSDDTRSLLVGYFAASNDSGHTVRFYPDQGTIRIARQQVDASPFLTEGLAGNEWQDQVDDEGQAIWELPLTPDEVQDAGGFRYTASAPMPAGEFVPDFADDVQLDVTWQN